MSDIYSNIKYKHIQPNRSSFVYRWEHPDGRFYIGKHKGSIYDGYLCGNHKLRHEICTDKQWHRTVLITTDNESDAFRIETMLIRANKNNPLCLNVKTVSKKYIALAHTHKPKSVKRG